MRVSDERLALFPRNMLSDEALDLIDSRARCVELEAQLAQARKALEQEHGGPNFDPECLACSALAALLASNAEGKP